MLQGTIGRIHFDGTNKSYFAEHSFSTTPTTFAIDWISRLMFWTSSLTSTMSVIKLDPVIVDGKPSPNNYYQTEILGNAGKNAQVGVPVSMCVDPTNG